MASGHSQDSSSDANSSSHSDQVRTDPTSPNAPQVSQQESASNSEEKPHSVADASANTALAQKIKDKDPEQAIDKPTQEFRKKRTSSASSTPSQKPVDDRHDLAGPLPDLRPLTPAIGTVRKDSPGSSRERDVKDGEEVNPEPDVQPGIQLRKAIFDGKERVTERDARLSDVDPEQITLGRPQDSQPKTLSQELATDGAKRPPLYEPENRPEQPTDQAQKRQPLPANNVASPFDDRKPDWLYRKALPICVRIERYNPVLLKKALRLFEICDFASTPDVIRGSCQDVLTREWTHRVPFAPFIQPTPPAFTASKCLDSVIREVYEKDTGRDVKIFEFCAGSSGPTPTFERLINKHRASKGERPIQFTISDLYPNQQAWAQLRGSSQWLDFEDEPVDAIRPPPKAMSRGSVFSKHSDELEEKHNERVFRLFNCSFHHFDDDTAKQILKSTMETSDGFAIIELQDRRWLMLLMMLGNIAFVWYTVLATCRLRGRFTYGVPNVFLYPFLWVAVILVLQIDGFVSCLRTREFGEITQLVKQAAEEDGEIFIRTRSQGDERLQVYDVPSWEIRAHEKVMHTLPVGYIRMITGVRTVPT
ncbi:uncharacterized protein N0V89_004223 [Didymosphaeria variabile]|uniref:Uncharacterized protein n=1 Tax=Didymosphaeria variabile TaxID=1932322 RepID=A0A9W8XRR8_9PLEO|nr:uncharacterized protein N0V89_004223 [Didymosphaeria variabile]KAJ4356193.1 hypothetical protein N0V89_004223 [Didymosphaeria variabile]